MKKCHCLSQSPTTWPTKIIFVTSSFASDSFHAHFPEKNPICVLKAQKYGGDLEPREVTEIVPSPLDWRIQFLLPKAVWLSNPEKKGFLFSHF